MITRRDFLQSTALGVGAALGPVALRQNPQNPVSVSQNPGPVPIGPRPGVVNPVVGLVLAGGGAKGSFEVGAVRYLYDRGIRPNIICGTSVGAINAIKLAEGEGAPTQGLAGLESIWLGMKRNEDMYVEGSYLAWLRTNKPDVYKLLPSLLVPYEAEGDCCSVRAEVIFDQLSYFFMFMPLSLTLPGLALGLAFPLLKGLADGVVQCKDLNDAKTQFDQQSPKALYDLCPHAASPYLRG